MKTRFTEHFNFIAPGVTFGGHFCFGRMLRAKRLETRIEQLTQGRPLHWFNESEKSE